MQLHSGNGAPVELEGRPSRIDFRRRSIHTAEDVELVVMQVDRNRIVGLKRRPLRPRLGARIVKSASPKTAEARKLYSGICRSPSISQRVNVCRNRNPSTATTPRPTGTFYSGLIRLHVLHHATEGPSSVSE